MLRAEEARAHHHRMGDLRMCASIAVVVMAGLLTACTSPSPWTHAYTLSVEVSDVGQTDPNAPSGYDLARLADATECAAWAPEAVSFGGVELVVRLLVNAQPDRYLIRELKGLPDVQRVVLTHGNAYASPPAAGAGDAGRRRLPCDRQRI